MEQEEHLWPVWNSRVSSCGPFMLHILPAGGAGCRLLTAGTLRSWRSLLWHLPLYGLKRPSCLQRSMPSCTGNTAGALSPRLHDPALLSLLSAVGIVGRKTCILLGVQANSRPPSLANMALVVLLIKVELTWGKKQSPLFQEGFCRNAVGWGWNMFRMSPSLHLSWCLLPALLPLNSPWFL